MGFNDEYLKLRKKRLEAEESRRENTSQNSKVYLDTLFPEASSDIAPVRQTTQQTSEDEDERKWYDGFLRLGDALSDGYQFGDVTKTLLGTDTDIATNLISGVVGWGEDAIDAGATGLGMLSEKMGWNDTAEKLNKFAQGQLYDEKEVARNILKNSHYFSALAPTLAPISNAMGALFTMEDWLNPAKEVDNGFGGTMKVKDDNSVLGDVSDSLIQSTGEAFAKMYLPSAGYFSVGDIITGVTVFGEQAEQALKEDATFMQAGGSGLISAGAEIIFEKFSGGIKIGGKTLDEGLTRLISKNISNVALRNVVHFVGDVAGESLEEVATEFVSKLGTKLYKEEDLGEILASEDALIDYIQAAIGGGLMGGAFNASNAVSSTKHGVDYKSGLANNEQKVVDKVFNDAVAEAEKGGKKLSAKQKTELYNDVVNKLEKGYIDIDTIEEVLGEDVYKDYKDTIDYEDDILKQYEELGKKTNPTLADQSLYAELKSQADGIKENSQREAIKSRLSEEVFGKVKDTKLAESYNERARRGQHFEADLSQYDEKQQEIIKRAVDSGILNNTNRTHEFVDLVAKISADKGVPFDFTNNAKLKESGFAIDGSEVNGFVTKDGISINIDSHKALQSTVGHEITHVLEGTELYAEMQRALFDYAKSRNDYQGRYDSLSKLYEGIEGADVDAELTADLVGDYLFTDENFVKHLSTQNRNVFQKMYDEIKYWLKHATAGSKEAKQLEKVKRAFDKAYKEIGKGVEGTKYSLSETTGGRFVAVVDNDILSNIDTSSWDAETKEKAKKAASEALKKFSDGIVVDGITRKVNRTSRREYTRSNYTERLYKTSPDIFADKMRAADITDDIVFATTNWIRDGELTHDRNDDFVDFDHGNTLIASGDRKYSAEVVVGIKKNGEAVFYDVVDMTPTEFDIKKGEPSTAATAQNSLGDIQEDSLSPIIPQNSEKSSSFAKKSLSDIESRKQEQLAIIEETNPAPNSYLTWIRSADDIKTLTETLEDSDWADIDEFDPDLTRADIEDAIESGKITVYSSYPIENGVFVSPSRMEAESYAGSGKLYQKTVNISDVAWIDPTQGQYAAVNDVRNSLSAKGEPQKRYGNYNIYGEDVRYEAPMQEQVAPAVDISKTETTTQETVSKMETVEDYAPITEEEANALQSENADAYAPVKEQYEAIKPERKKSTEPRLKRVKDGETSSAGKQRKWIGTSTDSEAVDGKVKPDDIPDDMRYYQPIPNKVTLGNANTRLDSMGYDSAISYFNSQFANKRVSLDDIALGERLIQEAVKRGDTKTAGELIQNVAILGTELGQKVQALSIIKRLTPEGQLRMLQKTVERGKTKGDKSFEGVEITQEMIDHILKTYGKDGTYDQTKLNEAVEDVKKKIADQMKVTALEKVNAWRYLSMLGNPKTHIRNLVSNVAMRGTVAVKNAVARTIESVAPIENRTKTWKRATDAVKSFSQKTAIEMKDVLSDGGKYSEEASIKEKRDTFKSKILNGVYNFNSDLLSKEDWWFSKPAFTNALSEYLTANGIKTEQDIANNPKIVAKAKQYATEQAQIATFRQYSWLANKINDIEKHNAATNIAVGAVLPFKKTPINIAKTALNYSPLGFAKTLTYDAAQVKSGKMEASELVDHLSQNITGSALTLVGYLLASSGFLNGGGEDDKEGQYDYQLGEQAYSITIGDATYSLSWLSPIAMPLFVGANAYEQLVEGKEWNGDVVVQTLAQTLDPLSEMSFLSSLDSVLSSYDSGIMKFAGIAQTAAQSYTSQFVPTLSSQVAAVMDDTKRTTKVAGDSTFKAYDEIINNLKYKIPGLRETLEPTTDIWGNEVKQTEDILTRAFETFIAPYSKREDIATEIDSEIKSLYGMTGDDGLIPSIPYNYINYKNEKYEMSAKEYTAYKEAYGQTAYNLLGELFDTETYRYASDEDKAEMVNKVYDYARDVAKQEFLTRKGVNYTNATKDGEAYYREDAIKGAIEHDMMLDEYTFYSEYPEKYAVAKSVGGYEKYKTYSSDLYDIKADKDENGKSISGSRKEKVADYINNLDADYGEKIILFKSEYNADDTYNAEIVEYLNNREDISYDEMVAILKELGFTVKGNTVTWD